MEDLFKYIFRNQGHYYEYGNKHDDREMLFWVAMTTLNVGSSTLNWFLPVLKKNFPGVMEYFTRWHLTSEL